ncbi:MAG TPA: hypothetical protein VNA20_04655 [Frankiaceae bacterium]|nr:hypothetical protein [Frankiaceae bacterium]
MRSHSLTAAVAALAVAVLAACGSSRPAAAPATQSAPTTSPAVTATKPSGAGSTAAPRADTASPVPGVTAAPGTTRGTGTSPKRPATPTPSESDVIDPGLAATPDEIPIVATVTPSCVPLGGTATLQVQTVEKADTAYVAVYSDGKNGAAPPFGAGYGGNEAGKADFRGQWKVTWVISPTAPEGAGHVVVVVGAKQKQRSVEVPFSVGAREAGGCGT